VIFCLLFVVVGRPGKAADVIFGGGARGVCFAVGRGLLTETGVRLGKAEEDEGALPAAFATVRPPVPPACADDHGAFFGPGRNCCCVPDDGAVTCGADGAEGKAGKESAVRRALDDPAMGAEGVKGVDEAAARATRSKI